MESINRPPAPLSPDRLTARVDPASLPFATTETLEAFSGALGQDRARDAIAFGLAMARPGYNIFVMGESGTGRLSLVHQHLQACAGERDTPDDWAYLNNFNEPREPLALSLPAGMGKAFAADMEGFVDNLLATFPAAFENPSHQRRKTEIERDFNQHYNQAIDKVERRAQEKNVALFRNGETISFAPMLGDEAASEEEFAAMPEAEREIFQKNARALEQYLSDSLLELPQWKREARNRLRKLNQDTVRQAIEPLLAALASKYAEQAGVIGYLKEVQRHLLHGFSDQLPEERSQESTDEAAKRAALIEQYAPKLLVSHEPRTGAPVVHEANPTYQNLFGRVEYVNEQGMLVTHHRLICAGAVHRANGGYLILEADKLVSEPQVWPALKRALTNHLVLIESPYLEQSAPIAMSLSPEAIPLDIKIILIGDRELYYLLQELDNEFNELFRVLADFDGHLARDDASVLGLIRLVKRHADNAGFKPLTANAAARLIEYSGRLAEHQQRLSARIGDIFELSAEAELVRQQRNDAVIDEAHIAQALVNQEARLGRISQRLLEEMLEGIILIDTEGAASGRINGLTVLEVGGSRFGSPARITATVSPGRRGIVDIEREAELGQAIHSKGVMILSGFLAHKFAHDLPLAISANIALEQSYGYIDGDSASLAEVLALISALTDVPILQTLAVTGSINQYGDVQAVGGVNEKIEGFFRLCRARGLNGRQGVVIPKANIPNLMLAKEIVDASGNGDFSVFAVASVDEALSLVTGKPAGAVNGLAVKKLRAMARTNAILASYQEPPPKRAK